MQTCTMCKEVKQLTEDFYKNKDRSTGYSNVCKICAKEYMKKYYKEHPKLHRTRKDQSKKYLAKLSERVNIIKQSVGCINCKLTYPPVCLDFHHTDESTKIDNVANIIQKKSWGRIQAEIDKCIVICANCHRMLHKGLIKLEECPGWTSHPPSCV